ncbi:MAG: zinc ribbon domain-containing protein [Chitinispirillales bacterium]|nr:zinc ribbon domain-containing protein [Chitinispirillales bacterium]
MPIYEYKCDKCENFFEELVTGGDRDKNVPCPSCGSADTKKRVSATGGIVMKGGSSAPPCATGGGGCPGRMPACAGSGCGL